MRSRRRGFLLVLALFLTVLMTIIGLSLMSIKGSTYSSSVGTVQSVQARALARSGICDIWIKLSKEPYFPPGVGDAQSRFGYREEVTDSDGNPVGSYRVVMDRSKRLSHGVILIESTGVAGGLSEVSATHTIYTELSVVPGDFQFKVWREGAEPIL